MLLHELSGRRAGEHPSNPELQAHPARADMASSSSEKRELELVDKVDFRILSVANNEERLQQLLGTYLPPLLLKAGSEYASVRSKVRRSFSGHITRGLIFSVRSS